jgi:hypothetical protein
MIEAAAFTQTGLRREKDSETFHRVKTTTKIKYVEANHATSANYTTNNRHTKAFVPWSPPIPLFYFYVEFLYTRNQKETTAMVFFPNPKTIKKTNVINNSPKVFWFPFSTTFVWLLNYSGRTRVKRKGVEKHVWKNKNPIALLIFPRCFSGH